MKISQLHIGIWKYHRKLTFKDLIEISYMKGHCGCHIVTFSVLCIEWLDDECLNNTDESI